MTTLARISNSSPLRSLRTRAPTTRSPSTSRSRTRWYGRMRAPCSSAERAHPQTSFQGSSAASGTRKARRISGLTRGSRRSASATGISSAGTPGRPAALEEEVAVLGVVPRRGHEHPAGVLDAVRCGHAKDPVLRDALARRRGILDRVPASRVQEAVKSPGGPVGEVTALHEDGGEAAQCRVARDADARRAAADDEDVRLERAHRRVAALPWS